MIGVVISSMEMRDWPGLAWPGTSQIISSQEFLNQTQTGWLGLAWRWVVEWRISYFVFMICVVVLQQINPRVKV